MVGILSYWIGALVVEGAMRPNVQSEFEEHANEERKHAEMIAKRIINWKAFLFWIPKSGRNWQDANTILHKTLILFVC